MWWKCLRTDDGDDEQRLIDVGGNDMALLGEVDALADDVVTAVFDLLDPVRAVLEGLHLHKVTYRHRICATDASDTEIAFYMAFRIQAIVHPNDVTATCRFDD